MTDKDQGELDLEVDETQEDEPYVSYDIATYPSDFTLSGIVDMWEKGDISIPDFQREFVWSIKQASLLIESDLPPENRSKTNVRIGPNRRQNQWQRERYFQQNRSS